MFDWLYESLAGFGATIGLSRLFYVHPRIWKQGNMLAARSDWRTQLLTLFGASRLLLVDPIQKAVRIRDRNFWFFVRWHRIPFDAVAAVLYGYSDLSPGQLSPFGAYRSMDLFTVGLQLRDGSEKTLFRLFGEGDFVNEGIFPDWFYWEEDMMTPFVRGGQETESRLFVQALSGLIGAPITNP